MAGTTSGGVSFQGLGSGTDFAGMITQLKAIESIPKQRMEVWRSEWSLRISAFQDIMTTMQEAKSALSAFSTMDKMLSRLVDSSEPKTVTATANSQIEEGVYSISVKELAKSAMFSNKQVFAAKDAKINESGGDETFSYSYKGTTRSLNIANDTTLEQFVNQINNDPKNPGVKASLIKSGTGYVFQIQGKDTGASNSLSIESSMSAFDSTPHFSGRDFEINNSGVDGTYTYAYNGKERSLRVPDGMTADEFVKAFNSDSGNLGVTASLVQKGSDYIIQMKDKTTKQIVTVPTTSDVAALGAQTGFTSGDVINSSGAVQTYKYSYLGKDYTLNIASGTTIDQFVTQFNAQAASLGLNGSLDGSGKFQVTAQDKVLTSSNAAPMKYEYTDIEGVSHSFDVQGGTTLKEFELMFNRNASKTGLKGGIETVDGLETFVVRDKDNLDVTGMLGVVSNVSGLDGVTYETVPNQLPAATQIAGLGATPVFSGKNLKVNDTGTAQDYTYTYNGVTRTFSVPNGVTMEQFTTLFNDDATAAGLDIKANVKATGSGYEVEMTNTAGEVVKPSNVVTTMNSLRGTPDNWYSRQATDARFTLNGWPQEFTSETNLLTEVIGGMSMTLKSTGDVDLTVTNDKTALKENIQAVVDAFNTLRSKIRELTKYDTDKDVKEPEVDENTGLLKMSSQFTWQKGSALTGNYGVQLLSSRMSNITTTRGKGYVPRADVDDTFNDLYNTLSQIGITTVADESDPEFGLLRIDNDKLDEAIEEDIRNVAELFSANKQPSTDSSNFTVASTGTAAKAGAYNVTYDVDPATHKAINVYINGAKANTDSAYPGRWTVGDMSNAAAGVAIQFSDSDLEDGRHYSESIRIKDGKVNEMLEQLNSELQPVVEANKQQAGAIPLLISNYQGIIKNIDDKINRETERLALWEKRQKAKFSRLDTLLTKYNNQMEQNTAALGQISSGSSSS